MKKQLDFIKNKNFSLQKTPSRKTNHRLKRKKLPKTYLINDYFPKYRENLNRK